MSRIAHSVLLVAAFGLVTSASAQRLRIATPGSMLLQGDLSYSYSGGQQVTAGTATDLAETHTVLLGPSFGYFVIDGLYIGAVLNYVRTTAVDAGANETVTDALVIGLRPAYYFPLRPGRALSIYVRGLLGYTSEGTVSRPKGGSRTELSSSGFAGGAGAGVAFAFGGLWGGVLQVGLDYTYMGLSQDATSVQSDVRKHVIAIATSMGVYF